MKTISELQQEIRSMQTELRNISDHLTEINDELLNYKDTGMSDSIYKRVYEIAETLPIIKHPIINYGYAVKNNYFAILILIATCEDSINDNQLLFMQRMIMADSQRASIDVYVEGIGSIKPENVIFKIQETVKNELHFQLVLDMLIIANLSKVKTRKTHEIIANISSFLGVKSEELIQIANIAMLILMQDIKKYQNQGYQRMLADNTRFGYYLSEIDGWADYLIKSKNSGAWHSISKETEYGEDWFYYEPI